MYNRYIPEDTSYAPVEEEPAPRARSAPDRAAKRPFRLPDLLGPLLGQRQSSAQGGEGPAGLLKGLRLDRFDSGDLLLLLIVLYLLVEGDDLDLIVALGLVLLMGLGDEKKED